MTEPDQGQLDDLAPDPGTARRRPGTPRSTTRCASWPTWPRLRLPIITIGSRRPMRALHEALDRPDNQRDDAEPG